MACLFYIFLMTWYNQFESMVIVMLFVDVIVFKSAHGCIWMCIDIAHDICHKTYGNIVFFSHEIVLI